MSTYAHENGARQSLLTLTDKRFVSSQFNIQWNSVVDKTYRVQVSTNLLTWQDAGLPVTAIASTTQWSDATSPRNAPRRFYRVRINQ